MARFTIELSEQDVDGIDEALRAASGVIHENQRFALMDRIEDIRTYFEVQKLKTCMDDCDWEAVEKLFGELRQRTIVAIEDSCVLWKPASRKQFFSTPTPRLLSTASAMMDSLTALSCSLCRGVNS